MSEHPLDQLDPHTPSSDSASNIVHFKKLIKFREFWARLFSPLLAKDQNNKDLEYDLHRFRLQRLDEVELPVYISLMAKANLQARDDDIFPLKEKVQEFLASERQIMLILGDSGAGKSTFNWHLESELLRAYTHGGPIPLFINLPAIDRPDKDLIGEHLRTNNFSELQIQELKQNRKFVLICDGYDESQLTVNLHTTNLFNRPGQWNVKMVISCRTQFLGQNYRSRFIPDGTGHYTRQATELFQEAVIAPFSKEQIEDYVEQYDPLEPRTWTTKDYMEKLTTIPNLMGLVKNPFLLSLSLEALPGVTEGKQDLTTLKITRVQLYDTFVRHWLDVNSRRLQRNVLTKEDRDMLDQLLEAGFISMGIGYATRLASAIFEHQDGNPVVQYVHIEDEKSWKAQFFSPDSKTRLMRESSLLNRTGSQYRFLHRSMLEYFLSCAVLNPSNQNDHDVFVPQPVLDPTSVQLLSTDGPLFKRNLVTEPSVIQFLCERVKHHPDLKSQLLAIIEQSKIDATAATAAANSISILVRAGIHFNSADLRGIRISGADLSDGQFDSAQFQAADLRGVNFARSWLRQAKFGDAQLDGVRFEELPYLQEYTTVNAVAFSPDGKLFAAALFKGLSTYDTMMWTRVWKHKEQTDVLSIAFSPNNRHLALGNGHGICRLLDVNGEILLVMKGHTRGVKSVAFSPCGKQIASASDDSTIRLWSSKSGACLFVLNGHEKPVLSVAYSADGRRLVSGSIDETIRAWDPKTGTPETDWVIHVGASRLAISADGLQFAVMAREKHEKIHLVDAITGKKGLILDDNAKVLEDTAFSPTGELLVSVGEDKLVRLWDPSSGQLISRLSGHNSRITTCTFSPDGQQIASGDGGGIIRLWEVNSNWSSSATQQLTASIRTVAYSHDGLCTFSIHDNNTMQHWDSSTGASRPIPSLSASDVYSFALSPNGQWLASSCKNGNIRLWNVRTDVVERVLLGSTDHKVVDMSFSHCCRWLASCDSDGVARLWDLDSTDDLGKVLVERNCLHYMKRYVLFSPVRHQIAVGVPSNSADPYNILFFDPRVTDVRQSLREVCLSHSLHSMEYSPDGQRLVLGTGASLMLLDPQLDELDVKLDGHTDWVHSVAYSPCGKWILSGSRDKTARLWSGEVDSWSCVAVVSGYSGVVTSVAWNPVVPLEFVTGSDDGSVRVWRISGIETGHVSVNMHWGSHFGQLCTADLNFKGTVGLTPMYRKLLVQRGAIDDSFLWEKDDGTSFDKSFLSEDDEESFVNDLWMWEEDNESFLIASMVRVPIVLLSKTWMSK